MTPPMKIDARPVRSTLPVQEYSGPGMEKILEVANRHYHEHLLATRQNPNARIEFKDLQVESAENHAGDVLRIAYSNSSTRFAFAIILSPNFPEATLEFGETGSPVPSGRETITFTDSCTLADKLLGSRRKYECRDVSEGARKAREFKLDAFLMGGPAVVAVPIVDFLITVTANAFTPQTFAPSPTAGRWVFPITRAVAGGAVNVAKALFSSEGLAFASGFFLGRALDLYLPRMWGSKKQISDHTAAGLMSMFGPAHQHPRLVVAAQFLDELLD